jgi:hypothetical protein
MKRIALLLVVVLAGGARAGTGQKIANMPFPIAGGQTVLLPVSDGGPIPAENDEVKIEVAGFVIGPSPTDPKVPLLTWKFAFTPKKGQTIEQVVVEEVAAADAAQLLVSDEIPRLDEGFWRGTSRPFMADPESQRWLYSNSPSVFVFKFSIAFEGVPVQVLYQPSWFPAQAKKAMMAGFGKR